MLGSLDKPILTAVIENIGNATPLTKSSYAHWSISIRVSGQSNLRLKNFPSISGHDLHCGVSNVALTTALPLVKSLWFVWLQDTSPE